VHSDKVSKLGFGNQKTFLPPAERGVLPIDHAHSPFYLKGCFINSKGLLSNFLFFKLNLASFTIKFFSYYQMIIEIIKAKNKETIVL